MAAMLIMPVDRWDEDQRFSDVCDVTFSISFGVGLSGDDDDDVRVCDQTKMLQYLF